MSVPNLRHARWNWLLMFSFYAQAYDSHCNIVLGEVEETVYIVEEDDNGEETIKVWASAISS